MPAGYRSVWLTSVGALVTTGACLGILLLHRPEAITFLVVGTLMGGLGSLASHFDTATSRAELVRVISVHALMGGAALVTAVVLGRISGALLALLVLLTAATSPWVVARLTRVRGSGSEPADSDDRRHECITDREPVPGLSSAVRELTDRELCRAWRASFAALQDAATTPARQRVVRLRHAYLDEFERRNPAALSAWLATEPRAAGSPDRFLFPPPREDYRDAS